MIGCVIVNFLLKIVAASFNRFKAANVNMACMLLMQAHKNTFCFSVIMDILAHFLWVFAIYWQHPKRWLAGFIGFLGDLIAFVPHMIYSFLVGEYIPGKPELHLIPQWVFIVYSLTHSLVIFAIVAVIVWYTDRRWFWLLGGWLLHIIIDIPTHTAEFFPTPFLWPLTEFSFSGISWATGWFMIANYGALAAIYSYLLLRVPRQA